MIPSPDNECDKNGVNDDDAPRMRFAGMVESGDPDSSHNIDEVVYGQDD